MRGEGKRGGFSLVEVLIVIIILAILSGLVAITLRAPGDDADAGKLANDIRALKSAYIAYYADNHAYLPLTASADMSSPVTAQLEKYAYRSLDQVIELFGSITIQSGTGAGADNVYIGFTGGPKGRVYGGGARHTDEVYEALARRAAAYGFVGANGGALTTGGPVLIQVR